MNRIVIAIAIAGLFASGCKKKEVVAAPPPVAPKTGVNIADAAADAAPPPQPDAPANPAEVAKPVDEPEGPITPMTEREVAMLNYAVYKFKEDTGRLPKSLQE